MAQLTDDCFAFGGALMPIEAAVALIAERVPVVAGIETVPLRDADGRIAAEDVRAGIDLPPFDNSAVDGYAVRHADLAAGAETILPVGGRVAAGHAADRVPARAAAIRIFTGAPMPPGFDTVFMQEDVRPDGDGVGLPPGLKPGANRRFAGEDVARGEIAIAAGRRLGPADLGVAAAIGRGSLAVRRRLRVAVFSTGDELTEPEMPLAPGAIHDSNRVMLAALLRRLGAEVRDLGILRDDRALLAGRIAAVAGEHDLVVTSGGVSTGEEDHVGAALDSIGRTVFWRLAIKPGRPVAMGLVGGVPLVGLPGNPVAAYVTLLFVVRPLLARLAGESYAPPLGLPVRAAFRYGKKAGRREFVRVTLRREPDGSVVAVKFPREGAGLLSSLTGSDGLAELADETTRVEEGDEVTFHPHSLLW
ncbi:gephyrin-like molybdotransferase Glp [uncultured Enterovirga sp.]|uniref:molybdopterin molybdotransferase MoeA n=1 Tax=uncultured Enterovirga sp. TaxID=2026352 RepID=UPI0035C99B67